jgi:hypothetical protein
VKKIHSLGLSALIALLFAVLVTPIQAGELGNQLRVLAGQVDTVEAKTCPPVNTCPTVPDPPTEPPTQPPATGVFNLPALAADAIPANPPKPARGGSFTDPVYKVQITRATDPADGGGGRMRHEYSRRQVFNKGSTRYLEHDGSGYWWTYNATTKAPIRKLTGLAGDAEPIWSATNPAELIYTSREGGKVWWTKNVETDVSTVLFDFTGKTPWAAATSYWTKGEGTTSADGRYLALMATAYNNTTKANTIYGLVVLDTQQKAIVSTLDASKWGGSFPDHISMSPSGRWVVPSWTSAALGTRAYTRDFSSFKQLHTASEHSDLAYGPAKEDFYVYANYTAGFIIAKNIDTGASWNLTPLYPIGGAKYSVHISGQAFDRPGFVVMSTYSDSDEYGKTSPAAKLQPQYRKVWIAELKQGGAQWSLAHMRQGLDGYFDEPQASPNSDLSLVIFSSNLGAGTASDDWIVKVPFK